MYISPFIKQCFVTVTVGINTITYGCAIGFPAILLPQLKSPNSELEVTKKSESWIAAILALSLLAGNFVSPFIMERLGRKIAHFTVSVIFLCGWYITLLASNVEVLIIGRIFLGIAGGILSTLRSILVGEYTSPRNRGAFLSTLSLTQAFGIMLVHLIGSLFSWLKTALMCVFFPFISLIMIIYTPESPSWLIAKGRYNESRQVFRWLRGNDEDNELESMILARMAFEQAKIKEYKDGNCFRRWFQTIKKKEFYKPILILIHSNTILHFSGGTTIASYSTVILGHLMGPKANVHFWMVFLDVQRVISNSIFVYIINRTKRRIMIFSTGALSLVSHVAIAIFIYLKTSGWNYDSIWLPALLINIQFFAVAVGTVPLPQVIGGEVLPLEYRSIGGTISLATGGSIMFLVLKTFPELIDNCGLHGTYVVYTMVIFVNLLLIGVLLPETKGKTLQQIEDEFRGRPLRLEEIEARQSLQSNPVENYKRKMSESNTIIETYN
ncbi:facilitated trehalose transporter Tret1-like [Danaus plexippus]|uniref:facilitated trehalose transporter Tret1-like n=1 Tax=Danaus plexippus TaxID=13037 RepID=UPI002AB1CBE7|nr:facilitated trehalose transporter Tret1-like [Danaus plexippus]